MQTLKLKIENKIAHLSLNRPEKANALNEIAWKELEDVFQELSENNGVRVIILSGGESNHFCAGIDLQMLFSISQSELKCDGRRREQIRKFILQLQAPVNAIENCAKPVIAMVHGGCIGAGLDIISASDMRYCTNDAYFTIKEIDMGMVADLGTLQRLPKIIPEGVAREMAYTGRKVFGPEAERCHLVNMTFENAEMMHDHVMKTAESIAQKSPLSIRGTKNIMVYSRDHNVPDGLAYMASWNAGMLLSNDLQEAFMAKMEGRLPDFED
ncbi:MAG: crotonase/enoyl-CoA hydratase family protein [Saprospiraceae bacterium]|jgi:enoyl-CoA hydratase|nr:crotonase/enoyl-CoA hydratase family protein [Saprospiraceae bacterium]